MVHEVTVSDGSLGRSAPFPWCLKLRTVCKRVCKLLNLKGRKSPTRGVLVKRCGNSGSSKNRISWTASFAYRQQQKQKLRNGAGTGGGLWSLRGYRKLKNSGSCDEVLDQQRVVQSTRSRASSGNRSSSFSFRDTAVCEDAGPPEVIRQAAVEEPDQADTLTVPPRFKPRWDEVVEMVAAESFEDLVDLEEFLGYYMLLNCPIFRELVQRFFGEFCDEFCEGEEEEVQNVNLFIPDMEEFPSFGESSERELECLPPTPRSKLF